MRKRNQQLKIYVNRKELQDLDKKVKKCGLTRSKYLRALICGNSPRAQPSEDYFIFIDSMQNLRNETEKLCELFYTSQGVNHEQLMSLVGKLDYLKLELIKAFLSPDKAV